MGDRTGESAHSDRAARRSRSDGSGRENLRSGNAGFGQILSDKEVVSLLSYVRRQFGAPSEPITPEMVSQVRAANQTRTQYWRVDELLKKPRRLFAAQSEFVAHLDDFAVAKMDFDEF